MSPQASSLKYNHVVDDLLNRIAGGALAPGSKIPSEPRLARQYKVSQHTIRQAKLELVKRGILTPLHRSGTYVSPDATRARVAVLWHGNCLSQDVGTGLAMAVIELDRRHGDELVCWQYDAKQLLRPALAKQQSRLLRDLQEFHPRVVIMPVRVEPAVELVRREGIPIVSMTFQTDMPFVMPDYYLMCSMAIDHLEQKGAVDIGVIGFTGTVSAWQDMREVRRRDWPRAWSAALTPSAANEGFVAEKFGYDSFHAIWKSPSRPSGLIVLDDAMLKGVMFAMCELGVKSQRDLRLAGLHNKGSGVFLPVPFDRMEVDPAQYADGLFALIRHLLADPTSKPGNLRVGAELVIA